MIKTNLVVKIQNLLNFNKNNHNTHTLTHTHTHTHAQTAIRRQSAINRTSGSRKTESLVFITENLILKEIEGYSFLPYS